MHWVYPWDFWSGKEMRGYPLPKSSPSFLPPSLTEFQAHDIKGFRGRAQPIGAELRTERSLSPFCCSGQSATKEGCCGLIPINLPGAEACQDCHRAVRPLVEYAVGAVTAHVRDVCGVEWIIERQRSAPLSNPKGEFCLFSPCYSLRITIQLLINSEQSVKQSVDFGPRI